MKDNINVNCKDDKGRSLLSLCFISMNADFFEIMKILLKKQVDPNMPDLQGITPFHYFVRGLKSASTNSIDIYEIA